MIPTTGTVRRRRNSNQSIRLLFLSQLLLLCQAVSGYVCNENVTCPAECCSEFGICGTTPLHCGGGCQSAYSAKNTCYSDRYGKKCKSGFYNFNESTWILNADAWNGDPDIADWVVDPAGINNAERTKDGLKLYMTPPTEGSMMGNGVRVSSTSYMLYGTFTASVKAGNAVGGMVTAFISLSDEKDEIDWEWVGGAPNASQTAYFYRGNTTFDPNRGTEIEFNYSLAEVAKEYSVEWTAERITWRIDNETVRVLRKKDTLNKTHFPSTPSRIQLGLWDGGASESFWVRLWAGGPIDWTQLPAGRRGYSAQMEWVKIQCAGDPEPTTVPKRKSSYTAPTVTEKPINNALDHQGSDYYPPGTPITQRPTSSGRGTFVFTQVSSLCSLVVGLLLLMSR